MLVTYVDRCAVCACSSLRDEGGRRPVPGLRTCGSLRSASSSSSATSATSAGCPCHDAPPAVAYRSARAVAAAGGNDAVRVRLFRRTRHRVAATARPAYR